MREREREREREELNVRTGWKEDILSKEKVPHASSHEYQIEYNESIE